MGLSFDEALQALYAVRDEVRTLLGEVRTANEAGAVDGLLTRGEVAERIQVSVAQIDRWRLSGDLPHVRLGTHVRFRRSVVEAFVAKGDRIGPRAKGARLVNGDGNTG